MSEDPGLVAQRSSLWWLLPALPVAWLALRRAPRFSFHQRVVVITGGSRGLGLAMARAFSGQGARVALLARDAAELARAKASLPATAAVLTVECDVRDPIQARHAIATITTAWGGIDVLVNNAGVILSAPFEETTEDDFASLMDVHLWGTLYMSRAALPYLRRRRGARIVNIVSIGGKVGVPHLTAYCASKFAQAGLSSAMGEELRGSGVRVVTVFPGLMRTGSHLNARFKGELAAEYRAFALAATLPGVSMSAERAARAIVAATRRGQAEAVLPFSVRQAARAAAFAPGVAAATFGAVNRLLPTGREGRAGRSGVRGADIGLATPVRLAATLGEGAADRLNQRQARRID
jgi:NAD(P)-dependent dehydrogenase (short-subunit alcohol dehydrogenase family)